MQEFSTHKCLACVPPAQLNPTNGQHVLAHIASHILHNLTINRSQELCGLCLGPANLCTIYLMRHPGWNYPWALRYSGTASCPNVTKFSYSMAMVSNVPLQCPYCPDGSPVVLWYNIQIPFQQQHQGINTMKHEDLWKLTPKEEEVMVQIWKDCRKQLKQCGKGKSRVPLKVSEAHSSHRLSRYVMLTFTFKAY
ncbi:hypothetical protein EDB86DRAFT_2815728 [Lactarius hatsudake]|nr:hypothetical protein EDB86DRAFT_2815728 [Lactarius hatsudake]